MHYPIKSLQPSTSIRRIVDYGKFRSLGDRKKEVPVEHQSTTSINTNLEDDFAPVLEHAEIATAYRLSPQRPKAITSVRIHGRERDSGIGSPASAEDPWGLQPELSSSKSEISNDTSATEPSPPLNEIKAISNASNKGVQEGPSDFQVQNSQDKPFVPPKDHLEILQFKGAMYSSNAQGSGITTPRIFGHTTSRNVRSPQAGTEARGENTNVTAARTSSGGRQSSELDFHRKTQSGIKQDFASKAQGDNGRFVQSVDPSLPKGGEWDEGHRIASKRRERERDKKAEEKQLLDKNRGKPPLRLLSLDGGGIRGYTMLVILEDLMYQTFIATHGRAPDPRKGERPPKPCEVFDLIGGTGIGGVIAVFLGRLRLSIAELKEIYPPVMESILQRDKRMLGIPYRSTIFRSTNLVDTLRQTISQVNISKQNDLPKDPFDTDDEESSTTQQTNKSKQSSPTRPVENTPPLLPEATSIINPGFRIPTTRKRAGSLPHRRKSMDDGYVSDDMKSLSGKSIRAGKRLMRLGVGRKKSLNDLGNRRSPIVDSHSIPPVPNIDPKYLLEPIGGVQKAVVEGNPDEILYDVRNGSCRTFVTAILKGSFVDQDPALLRTYNSPAEAPIEPNCTIWQACAATTAINMMFKPVQIGQHVFMDEGSGGYNPAPSVLKEAALHLWPGREVGCFVSIGTGKLATIPPPPSEPASWWEGAVGGTLAAFAANKRRLAQKLDACESTHQILKEHELQRNGVLDDDYFRFNVDLGWTEFDLNEWDNLGDMNTLTKRYLGKPDIHETVRQCGRRMGAVHRMREKKLECRNAEPNADANSANSSKQTPSKQISLELQTGQPSTTEPMAETIPAPVFYSELEASEPSFVRNKGLKVAPEQNSNQFNKRETFYIFSEGPVDALDSQAIELKSLMEENLQSILDPGMAATVLPSVPEKTVHA